jgi:hypothetical protein
VAKRNGVTAELMMVLAARPTGAPEAAEARP